MIFSDLFSTLVDNYETSLLEEILVQLLIQRVRVRHPWHSYFDLTRRNMGKNEYFMGTHILTQLEGMCKKINMYFTEADFLVLSQAALHAQ